MDARRIYGLLAAAVGLLLTGARFQTDNFVVETANPQLAQQFALAAENYRHQLAVSWLGKPMPDWSQRCLVTAQVGSHLGAGGATTFVFDRGEVFGWRMTVQGSAERILDSVLPHEITHTIFACHFRRPLPRWADEGGATTVEHPNERAKQYRMLIQYLRTGRGIAFPRMFRMSEYPPDIMPLYAQGYTLAEFLIQQGGRQKYLAFLADGLKEERWAEAVRGHYGYRDLQVLQDAWLAWVREGFPQLPARSTDPGRVPDPVALASAQEPSRGEPDPIARSGDWSAVQAAPGAFADPARTPATSEPAQKAVTGAWGSTGRSTWPAAEALVSGSGASDAGDGRISSDAVSGWQSKASSVGNRPGPATSPGSPPISLGASLAASPTDSLPAHADRSNPFVEPVRTQVSHPQPIQPFRQIILEWGHR